jgi:hypothetical protein
MTLSTVTLSVLEFLEEQRREWAASIERTCDNQIVGVSDESDTVSGGPGSLLTPEGRGRSRTRGVSP